MNQNSNFGPYVLALVAVVIAIASVFVHVAPDGSVAFGNATPGTRFPHGITVGLPASSPANLALISAGTCSLVSDSSIAATSTGTGTCATTGSLAGDVVIVGLATTTTKLAAQYAIVGTVATTDSTTVRLLNLTGGAAVPSATNGLGSSTPYAIYRAQ